MAHTKAAGKTKNVRDSPGQRLGIKLYAGQPAHIGQIIVRQNGTKWRPGKNVFLSKNHSLHAGMTGTVYYEKKTVKNFHGKLVKKTFVNVQPLSA